jgi:hypothetical protein
MKINENPFFIFNENPLEPAFGKGRILQKNFSSH